MATANSLAARGGHRWCCRIALMVFLLHEMMGNFVEGVVTSVGERMPESKDRLPTEGRRYSTRMEARSSGEFGVRGASTSARRRDAEIHDRARAATLSDNPSVKESETQEIMIYKNSLAIPKWVAHQGVASEALQTAAKGDVPREIHESSQHQRTSHARGQLSVADGHYRSPGASSRDLQFVPFPNSLGWNQHRSEAAPFFYGTGTTNGQPGPSYVDAPRDHQTLPNFPWNRPTQQYPDLVPYVTNPSYGVGLIVPNY